MSINHLISPIQNPKLDVYVRNVDSKALVVEEDIECKNLEVDEEITATDIEATTIEAVQTITTPEINNTGNIINRYDPFITNPWVFDEGNTTFNVNVSAITIKRTTERAFNQYTDTYEFYWSATSSVSGIGVETARYDFKKLVSAPASELLYASGHIQRRNPAGEPHTSSLYLRAPDNPANELAFEYGKIVQGVLNTDSYDFYVKLEFVRGL